jgi:hypothetical protein
MEEYGSTSISVSLFDWLKFKKVGITTKNPNESRREEFNEGLVRVVNNSMGFLWGFTSRSGL